MVSIEWFSSVNWTASRVAYGTRNNHMPQRRVINKLILSAIIMFAMTIGPLLASALFHPILKCATKKKAPGRRPSAQPTQNSGADPLSFSSIPITSRLVTQILREMPSGGKYMTCPVFCLNVFRLPVRNVKRAWRRLRKPRCSPVAVHSPIFSCGPYLMRSTRTRSFSSSTW